MPKPSISRHRDADRRDLSLARVVDAIKPRAQRYFVWDKSLPGFGVDVWPSGVMSWVYFYRVLGKQRRVKLGAVDRMTRDEARRRARAYQVEVDAERDPYLAKRQRVGEAVKADRARREAKTFADVAARYVAFLEHKRSARWAKEAARILRNDILPPLGALRVADVTRQHVEDLHLGMADRPFLANRAKAIVSAVITRAIEDGDRPATLANPAASVEDYDEQERDRILLPDEWARLRAAWPTVRAEFAAAPAWDTRGVQLRAIELVALTGARAGAVTPRAVGDVSLEAGSLRVVPAHKFVSRVVLGSAARRLVTGWGLPSDPRTLLFPGQARRTGERTARGARDARPTKAPAPVTGLAKAWARLCAVAKVDDLTLHDLRRTFGSVGVELGYSSFLVGGLLGHRAQGVTEKHYTQRPDALLLAAADAISDAIAERLGLAPAMPASKVLPLARARRGRA